MGTLAARSELAPARDLTARLIRDGDCKGFGDSRMREETALDLLAERADTVADLMMSWAGEE
jgi:hypothetical protein